MPGRNLFADTAGGTRQVTPGATVATGKDLFARTPEQQRADRLMKIARLGMKEDPGAGTIFSDAVTFGLQKPVAGLAMAAGGLMPGSEGSFGERYSAGVNAYQEELDKARANTPGIVRWPAEIGGTIVGGGLGGGPGPLAREGGSLIGDAVMKIPGASTVAEYLGAHPLAQAGVTGGTVGGIEGAARNSEDLPSALGGAALGILTGAPTSMALHGLISRFTNKGAREAAKEEQRGPEPQVLKAQSRANYKKLDDAGVFYDMDQAAEFGQRITDALDTAKFDRGLHPKAAALVDRIRTDTTGRPLSMTNLQTLRELASDVLKNPDPSERRIGNALASTLDDWVEGTNPAMGDLSGPEIAQTWKDARTLWRSARTAEDIGWSLGKAIRKGQVTHSGQNTENAIRQNAAAMLDRDTKPGAPSKYNAGEQKQLEDIAAGTTGQNWMRTAGNWLQSVPGSATLGATAGPAILHGLMTGNLPQAVVSAAVPAAAWAGSRMLKRSAADIAEEGMNRLIGTVSRGGKMPPTWDYILQGPPTRAKLALMQALKLGTFGLAGTASGEAAGP